jgi:hypothetical protein|uniref:NET domain-containing protein n=1 Tax=viral metagenome TaxID=1070528 RepID=A0A6C0IMT1_9ZZZZ
MEITAIVNGNNDFSISELDFIRKLIENMDKHNQVEILKLIYESNHKCINENKYGIHINMTELSNDIIEKINKNIKYVNIQENEINNIEHKKEKYISTYFST